MARVRCSAVALLLGCNNERIDLDQFAKHRSSIVFAEKREQDVRTFTCRTGLAETMFILANDEKRALELVRRELANRPRATAFEIFEAGRHVCGGLSTGTLAAKFPTVQL